MLDGYTLQQFLYLPIQSLRIKIEKKSFCRLKILSFNQIVMIIKLYQFNYVSIVQLYYRNSL
jgi:hypothetical protein